MENKLNDQNKNKKKKENYHNEKKYYSITP